MRANDLKLAVFESESSGYINVEEREALLRYVDNRGEAICESYTYTLSEFESAKRKIMDAYMAYAKGIVEYNLKRAQKLFASSTEKALGKYMKVPSEAVMIRDGYFSDKDKNIIELYTYYIENNTKSRIQGAVKKCKQIVIREALEYPVKDANTYLNDVRHLMKYEMDSVRYRQRVF